MTDLLIRYDGASNTAPKLRVNAHGWVEHHDETGSIFGLTPAHGVQDILINVEQYDEWGDE